MMRELRVEKKKESIVENLPLPVTKSQLERYRAMQKELDKRNLTELHELTRERIFDDLLNELEIKFAKSS